MIYYFLCCISFFPGPNNLILAQIGKEIGFKKGITALFGISLGIPFMIFTMQKLLLLLNINYLNLNTFIYYLSIIFIFLFIKIKRNIKIIGFFNIILLQYINPKSWITLIYFYKILHKNNDYIIIIFINYFFILLLSSAFWLYLGTFVKNKNNKKLNIIFNRFLNILSFIPLFFLIYNIITM